MLILVHIKIYTDRTGRYTHAGVTIYVCLRKNVYYECVLHIPDTDTALYNRLMCPANEKE